MKDKIYFDYFDNHVFYFDEDKALTCVNYLFMNNLIDLKTNTSIINNIKSFQNNQKVNKKE